MSTMKFNFCTAREKPIGAFAKFECNKKYKSRLLPFAQKSGSKLEDKSQILPDPYLIEAKFSCCYSPQTQRRFFRSLRFHCHLRFCSLFRLLAGWRYFDDRSVTETREERVVSKYAYVLFYKRRHTVHDSIQTETELPYLERQVPKEIGGSRKASFEDVDENELD